MKKIKTYSKDKRKSITYIYNSFENLSNYKKEIIYRQKFKSLELPILAFKTKKQGKAVWLISGIHGEEPAGVNAISENITFLNRLGKKIPLVILPLCNPKGYLLNWRYPNRKKISVGSSEHLLLDKKNKARSRKPLCVEAEKITSHVLKTIKKYPAIFVLDFHEDKSITPPYIYFHGRQESRILAKEIVKILLKNKMPIKMNGKSEGKIIENGVISNVKDSSINELLASDKIMLKGKIKKGPSVKSIAVIETNSLKFPLKKRIKIHSEIIKSIPKFIKLVCHQNKV